MLMQEVILITHFTISGLVFILFDTAYPVKTEATQENALLFKRGFGDPSEFISKRMCFAFMFTIGFLSFLGGFLLGRFVFDKELEKSRTRLRETVSQKEQVFGVYKNYSQFNGSTIIEALSESSIQKYLGLLSHSSKDSSSENFRKAKILRDHLTSNGFDLVSPMIETQVQLSYPSTDYPNEAVIINLKNGEIELKINDTREKYSGPKDGKVNTTVVESTIVYVNFGRNEDYQYLDTVDIRYSGKIFLLRAGKIPTIETVSNAVEHGAAGILIYLDPEQTEVERPLVKPVDLAKLHIHYGNHIDKWGGTIPVLEISSSDASALFGKMSSDENKLNSNWIGKLKTPYRIGGAFMDEIWVMRMKISTVNTDQTFYEVLGAMRGSQEPDRYVMLTNEKIETAREENSTSIIMELIRVLGILKHKGWKPHRSIVVAFWSTEGPNMHLSSYPESVLMQIIRKTVTYLKIDSVDFSSGESQTMAKVTPMLEKLFYQSAQTVALHNITADIMPTLDSNNLFIHCGVPFLMLKHYNAKTLKDVASFWGMIIWKLVESYKLPFSLDSYANFFAHSIEVIQKRFKTIPQDSSLYLDSLFQKLRQLISAIKSFEGKWARVDKSKSIEMRIMTDQLLEFTRFLLRRSDSSISTNNNSAGYLIFSRSVTGNDGEVGFGELQDLLQDITSDKNSENLHKQIVTHLASLIETINLCRDALNDGLDILIKDET